LYKTSRKTHVQFIIRDWISTKPLEPLTEKIKKVASSIVSAAYAKKWNMCIAIMDDVNASGHDYIVLSTRRLDLSS
jgi:hypothetical protein